MNNFLTVKKMLDPYDNKSSCVCELKTQHSVVRPRYMVQTGQLGSWTRIAGHVIGPRLYV